MRSLRVFLLLLAVLVAGGLAMRHWPRSFEGALQELLDGDADRAERVACTRALLEVGRERFRTGDTRAGLIAAMAAVVLEDRRAYERLAEGLAAKTPLVPGGSGRFDPRALVEASLAEPYLAELLAGHAAENAGRSRAAHRHYTRARVSARLFGAALAAELAAAGAARTR